MKQKKVKDSTSRKKLIGNLEKTAFVKTIFGAFFN